MSVKITGTCQTRDGFVAVAEIDDVTVHVLHRADGSWDVSRYGNRHMDGEILIPLLDVVRAAEDSQPSGTVTLNGRRYDVASRASECSSGEYTDAEIRIHMQEGW